MNGSIHHFHPYGLLNGLVILRDKETGSLWDHITGKAIHGPLTGYQLEVWQVHMTTLKAALSQNPETRVLISNYPSLQKWIAGRLYSRFIQAKVLMPFFFRWSMQGQPDPRLPELTQGLGVIFDGNAKYYPLFTIPPEGLDDRWLNRRLHIQLDQMDGVPQATWVETDRRPMQLLTRWYGFSFTYPGCDIFQMSPHGHAE